VSEGKATTMSTSDLALMRTF